MVYKVQRITLADNQPLSFYLEQETKLVEHVTTPMFFTWLAPPTVIYGRHQLRSQEVNETYCQTHHISIVQRQSGGGCVYADEGNLMVSYISPSHHSKQVFTHFLNRMATVLQNLGYDAVTTEHNDILVAGRKVSGNACYTTSTGTIVHGTLLYDVNFERLQHAITPSAEKLQKHSVQSVRQRVINLREIYDIGDIYTFRQQIEENLMR